MKMEVRPTTNAAIAASQGGTNNMGPLTPAETNALARELGKHTDTDLAAEFGITRQRVKQLRDAADIPAFNSGPPMSTAWPIRFTKAAATAIKRAMKVTGHTNRSEYVRDAVREKNDQVLKGGQK